MSEVELDLDGLMRQAIMIADDYLSKAYAILEREYDGWTVSDAIALAKVMAQDYNTGVMALKMQEIREALYTVATSVDKIAEE